jgi:5'-nucleotidase
MNKQRRLFLNQISFVAAAAALARPIASVASISKRINTLHSSGHDVTIYHTNDLNGNIDAVHENMGGLNQIKNLLENQETSGLLLDAGGFLSTSNSPAQQRQMIYKMNATGYHVAAIGNNELLHGQDHLASLVPLMQFTLVNCNLQFENKLSTLVKPYVIITSGKFKIGVTGVCNELKGIKYNDPIQSANKVARILKENEKCDLVICLSHLGYKQEGNTPDNQKLAEQSENIDMIIGGQNRKLFSNTTVLGNKLKHEIIVAQTAWDGLMFGRVIFGFGDEKQRNGIRAKHFMPGLADNKTVAASLSSLRPLEDQFISA